MSAATTAIAYPAATRTTGQILKIYLNEVRFEFLKMIRLPVYALSTILFPVMFYVLFGLLINRGAQFNQVGVATYLLASYGTFGVMGSSLFSFGVGLANER